MSDTKLFCFAVIVFAVFLTVFQPGFAESVFDREQLFIDLAGQWDFRADPEGVGEKEKWFEHGSFDEKTKLPGSMAQNGFGDDITVNTKWTGGMWNNSWFTDKKYEKYRQPGNIKVSFWLQPVKHYVGKAWYQKTVNVPTEWKNKQITLLLERCHWETKVWVDGKYVDTKNSLSIPNRFELGMLSSGKHRITVCVDNTVKINVGQDAHSVSDNTQTNWNGIVGKILLQPEDDVNIDDVQVYPCLQDHTAKVVVKIKNGTSKSIQANVSIKAESFNSKRKHNLSTKTKKVSVAKHVDSFEIQYPMTDDVQLWNEFSPSLYKLKVKIEGKGFRDIEVVDFGFREFATEGTQFVVNGRKTFLRGTLECSIFPLTGYPPTDVEEWARIIGVAKDHGLNHFRFHSWCPPRAAFQAADILGFYFQVEGPFWTKVGQGGNLDKYIYDECDRILKEYGNHPSFVLMAYGNEPGGDKQKEFLGKLVDYWKAKDPRHLYTSASGWPIIPQSNFHSTSNPRIQHWGAGLGSRVNAKPPETVTDYKDFISKYEAPVVSHEIGQWCVYPNLKEIKKYTGVTRAKNFEIFSETLKDNHMLDQADDFLMASGKLQTLLYKEDIESALRTPGFGGFQLLDLHDFPGQGTALVGVVDPFWESKGYVTAAGYHRFSCETVPLARMEKRIWTNDESFKAVIEVAHFGAEPIENAQVAWDITVGSKVYASGKLTAKTIHLGNSVKLGSVEVALQDLIKATKLNLAVRIGGTDFENDWDFWVYPRTVDIAESADIHIAEFLDEKALGILKSGGKVLLMLLAGSVKGNIPPGFSSIFWNTAWTKGQAPHTLGILCDPKHPALARFPTEYHSNWQWWDLVSKSQAMILNDFPVEFRPIVQVIDDWFTNRRLGLVFEAKVNGGKLLVCSIDLIKDIDKRPVARQMLHGLKSYMQSDAFAPKNNLEAKLIKDQMTKPSRMTMLGARVIKVDSQNPGNEGHKMLDGIPQTIWHTSWQGDIPGYPHEFVLDLKNDVSMKGFTALPRQDGNANGMIGSYEIYVSNNSADWGRPVSEGAFEPGEDLKTVHFDKVQTERFLKFKALSPINPQHHWASLAEFEIIEE